MPGGPVGFQLLGVSHLPSFAAPVHVMVHGAAARTGWTVGGPAASAAAPATASATVTRTTATQIRDRWCTLNLSLPQTAGHPCETVGLLTELRREPILAGNNCPSPESVLASGAPERKSVAVRVGEIRVPAAMRVDDRILLHELDTERLQPLEVTLEIARVDDAGTGYRSRGRIRLAGCARREDDLQVLVFEPDGHELDPAGRVLLPLLKPERVDVEVERLFLVVNEESHVRHLLQHCLAPPGNVHLSHPRPVAGLLVMTACVRGM